MKFSAEFLLLGSRFGSEQTSRPADPNELPAPLSRTQWKAGSRGDALLEIMNTNSCIIDLQVNLFIPLQKSEM